MIGALELGEEFFILEKLGQEEKWEEIKEKTPIVLKHFSFFKERLLPYAQTTEEKESVSTEKIVETLQRLHDAMDGFDLEGADEEMKKLRSFKFAEELNSKIDHLSALVSDVEMEAVMKMTQELIEEIKG